MHGQPGFSRDSSGHALFAGRLLGDLIREAGSRTPSYFYDVDAMAVAVGDLRRALAGAPNVVAYAVKANSAGTIVRAVASAGGGADVVSGAELELALACGVAPTSIVMSGVAKTDDEIDLAIAHDIRAIQIESVEEISRVAARARAAGRHVRVSLRINPGVDLDVHAHVATGHDEAKFGIARRDLDAAWERVDRESSLAAAGVSVHVGSMMRDTEPFVRSARVACDEACRRRDVGRPVDFVDMGGGFGIDYGSGPVAPPVEFARAALETLRAASLLDRTLVIEPGRAIVGPYGVLVARVLQEKRAGSRRFAMVDAGMNDLLRPALYGAHHRIEAVDSAPRGTPWRVVGPVCESADDFGEHVITDTLSDYVVIRDAGAYGFAMASEYNGRSLPSEVFVAGGRVVHKRQGDGAESWLRRRLEA